MTRWRKTVNGATLILADSFLDDDGAVMDINSSRGSAYALSHGFEQREIPDAECNEIADINADGIDNMNLRERGGVLKKVVKYLKGMATCFAVMLSAAALGDVKTAQLGDLKDGSSVVTNVTGIAEAQSAAAAAQSSAAAAQSAAQEAKAKADSHDAAIVNLNNAVGSWSRYWGGDDFVVTVTNYPSAKGANRSPSGYMPRLFMSWKTTDENGEEYQQIVWDEKWWQDWLLTDYLPTNNVTKAEFNAELAQKADRAWGFYDSHTGLYSPEGFTQISSPNIIVAANLAYQQTVTSSGTYWVLTYSGVGLQSTHTENDFFRISDAEGKSVFEIVKGDKQTVGAQAGGVQVYNTFSPAKIEVVYEVESDAHPMLHVCRDLRTQEWKSEEEADCPATVSWSGQSGHWVVQAQAKAATDKLFLRATYEKGGDTYIKNTAPVSMTHLYIGGQKYAVSVETVNGKKLLVLTDAH